MTTRGERPFDPFGLAAERARLRKLFGLPELVKPFDLEVDAWACLEGVLLGRRGGW